MSRSQVDSTGTVTAEPAARNAPESPAASSSAAEAPAGVAGLPLAAVKVLDVSSVLAGPVAATLLGDFGADVVKVEQPRTGDFTRRGANAPGGRSAQWLQEGRNKRSVTIDLRRERGRELLLRLVPTFDVVLLSGRPATLRRWGLSPENLTGVHPQGIHVYVTGYGLTGPYRDRGAFDRIASAFAGLTYVSGEPGRPPVRQGYALIDYMTAYLAAFGTMLALYERDTISGRGQVIDLALYETGFRASEDALLDFVLNGRVRERTGNTNPYVVPASDFETADGHRIALHAGTDTLFYKLCQAMGEPDLPQDPRYANHQARVVNQAGLYERIQRWVGTLTRDETVAALVDVDVPVSPIMSVAEILDDPHYWQRGTLIEVADDEHGRLPMPAAIPTLSRTPGRIRWAGETLGAHTDDVLTTHLGLSDADIEALRREGAI